jgi:hypothetical protein
MTTSEDQQQKEALAAFTATLHSVGTNLEAPLRDRAANIQSNAIVLERQEAELAENTARLARQNGEWIGLADETREGLKEIGDVQNWAEMIERDLLALEDMMDNVEGNSHREEEMEEEDVHGNGNGQNGHVDVEVNVDTDVNNDADPVKKTESRGWFRWW